MDELTPVPVTDTAVQQQPPIPISLGIPELPPLSDKVLADRTDKISYGLNDINKSYEDIWTALSNGKENDLRTQTAADLDVKKARATTQLFSELAKKKQGPLTTDEMNYVSGLLKSSQEFTDPKSVFEVEASKRYINNMYASESAAMDEAKTTGSWFSDALRLFPGEVKAVTDAGQNYLARDEYIKNRLQDSVAKYNQQSMPGYLADKAKEFLSLGLYSEWKLRGNVPGSYSALLGSNLEGQRINLYRLPYEDFKKNFDSVMDRLEAQNPGMAVEFANSMLGMSQSEILGMNFGTAANVGTLPIASSSKAIYGAFTKKAVADMVKSASPSFIDTGIPTKYSGVPELAGWINPKYKVRAAEGAGDLGSAAVHTTTDTILQDLKGTGNPLKEVVDNLPRNLRQQSNEIASNTGNASRELVTRIQDAYEALGSKFLDMVQNMVKGERIPAALATERGVQVIKDAIRNSFPGPDGRILDVGNPIHESISNTWWSELRLGRTTGEYFANKDEARSALSLDGFVTVGDKLVVPTKTIALQHENFTAYRKFMRSQGYKDKDLPIANSIEFGATKRYEQSIKFDKIIPESVEGFEIKQDGKGFYISKHVPVPEQDPTVRAILHSTEQSQTPDGFLNSFMGWLRTPDDTLSADARQNAKVATYGPNLMMKLAKDEITAIARLAKWTFPGTSKKERWLDWERTIKAGQTMRDPVTGDLGYLFKTVGELENHYLSNFKRLPIEGETEAYFAFKRWVEMDTMVREIGEFRNRATMGVEMHNFKIGRESTGFIPGVHLKEMPSGKDNILVMGDKAGQERVIQLGDIKNIKELAALKEQVQQGTKRVIELYEAHKYPLENFGKVGSARVRYVVGDRIETKPLSFASIPRQGNRYWDYDYPFYLKQAIIKHDSLSGNAWYRGDKTILAMSKQLMSKDIADKINQVRLLLKDGKELEASQLGKTLPMPWEHLRGWFKDTTDAAGKFIPAHLSLDEPIVVTPRNKLINQLDDSLQKRYGDSFKDGTKTGSLAIQRQIQYTGIGDPFEVHTIQNEGSRHQPLYNYQPANKIDSIPMMNRALSRISKSLYMDDYRMFAIEHWIQEAKPYLKGDEGSIADSAAWHFYNPQFRDGTPVEIKSRLMGNNLKNRQIFGETSEIDKFLYRAAAKLSDSLYEKGVPNALDPSWMLPKLSDAGRFIRGVTFDAVIGVFALPQFLVQNMTYVTIAGIEGYRAAGLGTAGATLHAYSRLNRNPAILNRLDEIASKMGWKPGEWLEANRLFHKTGFGIVGQEHVMLDNPLSAKVVSNGAQQFLDLGRIFFKSGEKSARYGSWYTAFKKFRDANPTGPISNYDLGKIFENAEMLSGNMSTASKSVLQRGPLSFPTQFLGYNMRLAELFLGKRLGATPQERLKARARLIGTYAAFFGAPAAGGLGGFPFGDFFRQTAIDNGYVPGDNAITSTFMEGVPAALMHFISGNFYNIGQRYGSPGFDLIRDALVSDKTVWSLMGGASGTSIASAWEAGNGFRQAMMSIVRDEDKHFPLTMDLIADMIKPFSTEASNISKTWTAINTGKLVSRKDTLLAQDISPLNALFMHATGLQPTSAADVHNKTLILNSRKDQEHRATNGFKMYFDRALDDLKNNDPDAARNHFSQARGVLKIYDYPTEKIGQLISQVSQGRETLIDSIDWRLYMKEVPASQREQLMKTFQRTKQLGAQ